MIRLEQLKLSHKGVILVSVPLLFGIVLLSTLSVLLDQAESEAKRFAHIKSTIEHIVLAQSNLVNFAAAAGGYAVTRVSVFQDRYEQAEQDARQQLDLLKSEVSGDPKMAANAQRYRELAEEAFDTIERVRESIESGGGRFSALAKLSRLKSLVDSAATEQQNLVGMLRRIESESPKLVGDKRTLIRNVIAFGVLANVVLSLLLAFFFSKGVVRRLAILTDNSNRLAIGKSLHPVLEGFDEIAGLDNVFHRMAQTLAEAARKERAIVENAVDVICSIDRENKFAAVNAAALSAWGYGKEELIGKSLLEFVVEDEKDKTLKLLDDAKQGRSKTIFETCIKRKDGLLIDSLWSAHWVEEEQSLFCVAHDITDRKEIERLRKEFVSMVTHDLKTPLTSIHGALDLLCAGVSGPLPSDAETLLSLAERNTRRLLKLVMDLGQMDRMESGQLELQLEQLAIDAIVTQSLEAVKVFAEQQDVILKAELSVREMYADGDRITQVLVNLLSNAVKFSPKGGTVEVYAGNVDGYVELKVADQGRGIPVEYRTAVFERYKQVEVADATKKGGSGLGLPICKMIVEQHGGTIGVESEVGKGSTFWLRLPSKAD